MGILYTELMNKQIICILMLFALASFAETAFGVDRSEDEAAVRSVVTRQQESWNRHEAKAYAETFTEDADVVNVLGWWWKGRPEIEKKLTDAFVFVFRESTLTFNEVNVKFLSPELALVHARWTMVGAKTPSKEASAPQQGIQTQLLQKRAGKWSMVAVQNTNATPEMPFPKGPPTPATAASASP
jgi:uncharacterized protein (TIGR02246 family)